MSDQAGRRALDALRLQALAGVVPRPDPDLPGRAARALRLATQAGAPMVAALDAADAALADDDERARAVTVASAQSRAVAAVLLGLPAVMLPLLSGLLQLDPVSFYTSPAGAAVGVVALGLLAGGTWWIRCLVRRVGSGGRSRAHGLAQAIAWGLAVGLVAGVPAGIVAATGGAWWSRRRGGGTPPAAAGLDEVVDLVATATAGGMGPAAALRLVAGHRPELEDRLRRMAVTIDLDRPPGALPAGLDRLVELLGDAHRLGAPVVPALRDLARRLRAREQSRVLAAAQRLPARLTFPTALCLLPGSLLLVGAPLVASGLNTAGL